MPEVIPRNNPCYCIKFRRAAKTLTKFYDQAFAPFNITTSQFSLLNDIQMLKSCNKSELAQYARLDRTTIIRNLNVLREKGLIQDVESKDHRNTLVQITEAGASVIKEGNTIWKQVQQEIKSSIGPENMSVLKQIFEQIEFLNNQED